MKKQLSFFVVLIVLLLSNSCKGKLTEKINPLIEKYKSSGFKVKVITASKTGKAKSALLKGENPSDFIKYQYSIKLTKYNIEKKVIIRIYTEKEVERNYYNLKSAMSGAPNSYFVLKNGNMILTMFTFDIKKERKILEEIGQIFKEFGN